MGDCASRSTQEQTLAERDVLAEEEAIIHMAMWESKARGQFNRSMTEDQLYQLVCEYFDTFDDDNNGYLTFEDIVRMLAQIQANTNSRRKKKVKIEMEEARGLFLKMDVTGDGRISKEEFYHFYKRKY